MDSNETLEKLTEAINEDSWVIIEELIEELEAEAGFSDPFEDYDEEEF
tara:strand:- start:951 stop:1094 length:144 start_codon:yes stop_codon:yes gene_type:complete